MSTLADQHPSARTRPRTARLSFSAVLVALGAAACGLALAVHYPLGPIVMVGLFAVSAAVFFAQPHAWLMAVPALLPVIGLAPWTGWITFEEIDLLVLAAAAGGYARFAWRSLQESAPVKPRGARPNALVWLIVLLFAVSALVAMFRGMADAGGFDFAWFHGYHEPMNSLRLTKPLFLALLMVPLWRHAAERTPEVAMPSLVVGLMLGLASASLATVWERAAFTDLLNFSSDYRTTGLFWEMHVGGAALDGFLALTMPFAVYTLLSDKTRWRWAIALAAVAVGGYSCLTTFSRGVYLAIPIGIGLMLLLQALQARRAAPTSSSGMPGAATGLAHSIVPAIVLVAAFAAGTSWMFASSGYRGMLALFGASALLLVLPTLLQRFRPGDWLGGVVLGVVFVGIAIVAAWLIPKGAYLAYIAAAAATAAAWYETRRRVTAKRRRGIVAPLALAGFMATVVGIALVGAHWGGEPGLQHALPAVGVLLLLAGVAAKPGGPAWPQAPRWQAMVLAAMVMAGGIVGVFGGGVYMTERFSTGGKDFEGRIEHWRQGLGALNTPLDWALGKGMGRFPSAFFFAPATAEHPGDYRLAAEGQNTYLTLVAGQHTNGWGEILRLSQRVEVPANPVRVDARVRAAGEIELHFEICEKHLLYNAGCVYQQIRTKSRPGEWQDVQVALQGGRIGRGTWYAPKLLMFSMAMATRGGRADIDNVVVTDASGRQLVSNGDFSEGLSRWFFSSDRHHMPWHIKSMIMNVLFDQGVVGLLLWTGLLAGAMWRVSLGHARQHPLAPPLAGALVGFLVVGLFDSLLDVPRVAFVFYFLMLLALTIRIAQRPSGSMRDAGPTRPGAVPSTRGPLAALALPTLAPALALLLALAGQDVMASQALPMDKSAAAETSAAPAAARRTVRVGPSREVKTIAQAARQARDGDTIEVDAGDYVGDVAVWTKDDLTLRAVAGRVRLRAQGAAAEGKGIWVIRATNFSVQGFDFEGAAVPDRNGAGIRFDKGSLRVRDCSFTYNEMGLLTGNDPQSVLEVENSEFAHNSRPDGHNHNLYVGRIARLTIQGSYLHHARTGHLLKSRAAVSHVLYNRLTDEPGGTASYELEFPNGGVAYVIGNIIAQGARTENQNIVSFGAEGYKWPTNEIYLVHNTLIDQLPSQGVFLRVMPGAGVAQAVNNLLVGKAQLERGGLNRNEGNFAVEPSAFESFEQGDYRLRSTSTARGKAVDPGQANGQNLTPTREYLHPRGTRPLDTSAHNPGAAQRAGRSPG